MISTLTTSALALSEWLASFGIPAEGVKVLVRLPYKAHAIAAKAAFEYDLVREPYHYIADTSKTTIAGIRFDFEELK